MRRLIAIGLSLLLLAAFPAVAQQPTPAPKDSQSGAAAPDATTFDQEMARMQAHMKAMQDQMARIRQSADPAERQRLMREHMASMQAGMGMMRGAMGCCAAGRGMGPGMGPGMGKGGGMMGGAGGLTPEQMQQRHQRMQQMMEMQQSMMEQMLEHQQMLGKP